MSKTSDAPKSPSSTDPRIVRRNAERVAAQHADYEEAETDEEGAYADLFESILLAAEPALSAISSLIPNTDRRGLLLIKGEREEIWWLESGVLMSFPPETECTPTDVAELYGRVGIVDAIMRICTAIEAQLRGGKAQANEKIRRRADQIHALATLARGLS